jgi:hypothetical protein
MKCVACDLENPQSNELCYRCSHPLDLSRVVVEPPRQTAVSKVIWTVLPLPRVRYYQALAKRSSKYPYLMWLVSILPGVGHALLGRTRWAFGLGLAWFLTSILETGTLTLRPGSWVMMVQCFAMSDAFLRAREKTEHWSLGLVVNIITAIILALTEMYLLGGILS